MGSRCKPHGPASSPDAGVSPVDALHFDALTRAVTHAATRRSVVTAVALGLAALRPGEDAEARKHQRKQRKRRRTCRRACRGRVCGPSRCKGKRKSCGSCPDGQRCTATGQCTSAPTCVAGQCTCPAGQVLCLDQCLTGACCAVGAGCVANTDCCQHGGGVNQTACNQDVCCKNTGSDCAGDSECCSGVCEGVLNTCE
jgi:hypothetical protein